MEHLKNIEIKNFKSIRHQVIEGCKRINVFIGYPNVGKSNILEALSLYAIDWNTGFSSFVRMENDTTLFFNGNIDQPLELIIDGKYRSLGRYENDKINFVFQFNVDDKGFEEDVKPGSVVKDRTRSFELNKGKVDGFETNPPMQQNKPPGIKRYRFKRDVRYKGGAFDRLDQPFGDNIFDVISANQSIRKEVSELFDPYDLKFPFDQNERKFRILKSVGENIFLIPYSMIADTLQRLIFHKTAISSNQNSVLLFEEPEAHMFPPYTRKFTADVIFDKTNQFFMATHSPYVLESFMEDAPDDLSIYLVYYENGETKVKLMGEKDMKEVKKYGVDLFYNLESYLKHGEINNA